MTSPRTRLALVGGALASLILFGACGGTSSAEDDTATAAPVELTPTANRRVRSTTTESTVRPSVTDGEASSTTGEPTTTVAPEVTAPVQTVPPTTYPPTVVIPKNIIAVPVSPVPLQAVGGRSGPDTAAVQMRLIELGFWLSAPDGQYGLTTSQAVMAFQKYVGLPATGRVDGYTAAALQGATERSHSTQSQGSMVEVDKDRQLLFVVQDGLTIWTINTSTGSGREYEEVNKKDPTKIETGVSITRNGDWKVYRERPEGWWEGDLGQIYRPKYFSGGQAIHGSNSIPNQPASHGCVRVSVPAMDMIWASNLVPRGTHVWVHGDRVAP